MSFCSSTVRSPTELDLNRKEYKPEFRIRIRWWIQNRFTLKSIAIDNYHLKKKTFIIRFCIEKCNGCTSGRIRFGMRSGFGFSVGSVFLQDPDQIFLSDPVFLAGPIRIWSISIRIGNSVIIKNNIPQYSIKIV